MKSTDFRRLRLRLLGTPQVYLDGEAITGFRTAKAEALLYYLAVTGQGHSRETLADLLWSEMPEAKAKRNLTQVLSLLRKRFEPFLEIEPQHVGFKPGVDYWLDVAEFEQILEAVDPKQSPERLRQAVDLYQDDFLEGFYLKDAFSFEAWALAERERLRELMLQALQTLVVEAINRAEYAAGLDYAERLLSLEPWHEMAHRQMMRLLALSGQRETALAQYETCRQVLVEALGVEPMAETTALFERLRAAASPPPHNVSPPPNVFVGRKAELQQIERQLAAPACRLLTIVGPGGIGKTRLALEAARRYLQTDTVLLEPDVSDGVYVVSLASIAGGQDLTGFGDQTALSNALASAIADAVGFSFHGGADLQGQLLNHLGPKAMLLVLDNFEHLITSGGTQPGFDLVAAILQQASQVKLLVTSRERLNLQEEWVIEVAGLEYPWEDWQVGRLEDWTASDVSQFSSPPASQPPSHFSAVALFVQRAQQTVTDFILSETELPQVVRICQLVEGMPLGLELAASWLHALSCAEIVAEIERSLDFLAAPLQDVPVRHRSLRAVFEHSWAMLSEADRAVFSKLSIFRGGFSRDAAAKVTQASLITMTRLVDKSLLRRRADGRYELHELLRQYATEKLWNLGSAVGAETIQTARTPQVSLAVWLSYSRYYLNFVSQRAKLLSGGAPQQATTEVRLELDNIRQAWQWAVTEGQIETLESAIDGLSRFYDQSGLFQEGELVFDQAAAFLQTHATALDQASNQARQAVIARLWIEQARFLTRHGAAERALEIIARAVNLAETLQAATLMALAARQQGESLYYLGHYPAAQQQLERALTLAQTARLPAVVSRAQLDLGIVAQYQGLIVEAQGWLEQARQGFQALDDRRSLNLVLLNLGAAAIHHGDHQQGRHIFEQALDQVREMDDLWIEGMLLNNLGITAYEEGRYTQAQTVCQQALNITRRLMDGTNELFLLHSLGNIARDQGAYAEAQQYYHHCLAQSRDHNDRDTESYALADLGLLLHHLGEQDAARDHCQQAAAQAKALENNFTQSLAQTHLGHVFLALGLAEEAGDAYQQAVALRRESGEPHRAVESQAGFAAALLAQDKMSLALAEVEAVLAYLAGRSLTGIIEPFRVYLTCYRVLRANQDPRAAEVLAAAYRQLQERAAALEDERLRQSFLENVPANKALLQAFAQDHISS